MSRKGTRKLRKRQQRKTNWPVIGGVFALGIVVVAGLMALALQEPSASGLEAYCNNNPDACIAKGAEDAPITMIEIMDFSCPHCRDFNQQTAPLLDQQYVEPGQVRLVSVPYARVAETIAATNASMCANEQGAYYAFSDAMFARFDEPDILSPSGFTRAAEAAGLDIEPFSQCVDEGRYIQIVRENVQRANAAGVTGTPSFFIDGRKLEGNQPLPVFQQRIESLLDS